MCLRTRVSLLNLCVDLDFRARRAAKEAKEAPPQPAPEKPRVDIKKFVKIGRPGYKGKKHIVISCILILVMLNKLRCHVHF